MDKFVPRRPPGTLSQPTIDGDALSFGRICFSIVNQEGAGEVQITGKV
jgi:hypothetical protein